MSEVITNEQADKLLHAINSVDERHDDEESIDLVVKAAGTLLHEHEKGTFKDAERWRNSGKTKGCRTCLGYCNNCNADTTDPECESRCLDALDAERFRKLERYADEAIKECRRVHITGSSGVYYIGNFGYGSDAQGATLAEAVDAIKEG